MLERIPLAAILLSCILMAGCGSKPRAIDDTQYSFDGQAISVHLPGSGWSVEEMEEQGVVILQRDGMPGWFVIQVTGLGGKRSVPSEILSRELFVEFTGKRIYGPPREKEVGGVSAAVIDVGAELEGRSVMIRACSVVYGERIYDFVCWARPENFDAALKVFDELLSGIKFQEASSY